MKQNLLFLIIITVMMIECRSNTDVLPTGVWSAGCVELAPYQGSYRLSGMCCAYLLIPKIELNQARSFTVTGSYHAFTGAGFSNVPILITGQLSSNGNELTIGYSLNSSPVTYRLTSGPAKLACFCGCD
jgi:hypothetical protein